MIAIIQFTRPIILIQLNSHCHYFQNKRTVLPVLTSNKKAGFSSLDSAQHALGN